MNTIKKLFSFLGSEENGPLAVRFGLLLLFLAGVYSLVRSVIDLLPF